MPHPELGPLVALRRMYFGLVLDYELEEGRRARVGYVLNLFGAHRPGDCPSPGGPRSLEIFRDLRRVARVLVDPADAAFAVHEEPFNRLLFDAPALRTDEVSLALTLRLRPGASAHAEEASLKALRERLRALGLFEGAWRPSGGEAGVGRGAAPAGPVAPHVLSPSR